MATRKSVDQILDGAADILEKHGWVTESCYDAALGSFCVLGAIEKTVYPKTPNSRIGERAYPIEEHHSGRKVDPRHLEAVQFLARRLAGKNTTENLWDDIVYGYNDGLDDGVERDYDFENDKYTCKVDEKVRLKSSRKVVTRLRNAAKAYRKQQAKVAA